MTSEQKKTFWQQHIDGWRQSQLSQRDYCEQNDLTYSSFSYWRTRINRLASAGNKLIPVKLSGPSASVKIFLPDGLRLDVPAHALAEILPIVYRTVQAS